VHHCVIKLVPLFEMAFQQCKRLVGKRWCMVEAYIKVKGHWKSLYRAVDKEGKTVDFLQRTHRNRAAASRARQVPEQHHRPGSTRAIKCIVEPMMGFKSFRVLASSRVASN
jgi:transposase-like protein